MSIKSASLPKTLMLSVMNLSLVSCVEAGAEGLGSVGPADDLDVASFSSDSLCGAATDVDDEESSDTGCLMPFSDTPVATPVVIPVRMFDFSLERDRPERGAAYLSRVVRTLNSAFAGSRFSWVQADVVAGEGEPRPQSKWQAARIARRADPGFSRRHLTVYRFESINGVCGFASSPGFDMVYRDLGRAVPNPGVYLESTISIECGSPSTGWTVAHEVGHWLGLEHSYAGGCQSDPGDLVSDTPPSAPATFYIGSCAAGSAVDTTDTCPNIAGTDPLRNFMSYSVCAAEFTPGQLERASLYWTHVLEPAFIAP